MKSSPAVKADQGQTQFPGFHSRIGAIAMCCICTNASRDLQVFSKVSVNVRTHSPAEDDVSPTYLLAINTAQ